MGKGLAKISCGRCGNLCSARCNEVRCWYRDGSEIGGCTNVKGMRECAVTDVQSRNCLTHNILPFHLKSSCQNTQGFHHTPCSMMVSDMEQQRFAGLEQQLHRAETAVLATETRAAQLDATQNEDRAMDLKSIGKRSSFDGQAGGFRNFRFQPRSDVPIFTVSMRQGGNRQVSTAPLHTCALVRWCSDGGHGERT